MHHNVLGFGPLMAKSSTNYEGVQGPHAMHRWASGKNCSIKVWCVAWLKKVQRKKVIWRERGGNYSRKGCTVNSKRKIGRS